MHQNGLSQSVSQSTCSPSSQARQGMEEGGDLALPRDREMEASVSVRERSGAVSGDTASSNNPAGMFTTNFDFTEPVEILL